MKNYLSLVFNVLGHVMTFSLAVYLGAVIAESPHAAPFSGYADTVHFLYLGVYILIAAFFYRVSEWLA